MASNWPVSARDWQGRKRQVRLSSKLGQVAPGARANTASRLPLRESGERLYALAMNLAVEIRAASRPDLRELAGLAAKLVGQHHELDTTCFYARAGR